MFLSRSGLGTFFAHKLRSAVLYDIFQASNDTNAADAALEHYQKARDAWATMAERAKNVYRANISYGSIPKRSGHWLDRLPGIDSDIAAMKTKIQLNKAETISRRAASRRDECHRGILPSAVPVKCSHTPPERFTPGNALEAQASHFGRVERRRYQVSAFCATPISPRKPGGTLECTRLGWRKRRLCRRNSVRVHPK